jgi:hypothetical protein
VHRREHVGLDLHWMLDAEQLRNRCDGEIGGRCVDAV